MSAQPASAAQAAPIDVSKELDAMKKRIEQLEAQLAAGKDKDKDKDKDKQATAAAVPAATATTATPQTSASLNTAQPARAPQAVTTQQASANLSPYAVSGSFWSRWLKGDKAAPQSTPVTTASLGSPPASAFDLKANAALNPDAPFPASAQNAAPAAGTPQTPAAPPPVDNQTPFAYADFTWMNAVSRNHDSVLDGKYFSPEVRTDVNYIYDYQHPIDHTLGGTTEGERTGEIVLQQFSRVRSAGSSSRSTSTLPR